MRRTPFALAAALASLALLAAACGGSKSPSGVASIAATTTSSSATTTSSGGGLVAFSQCMRANGVPSFPDPQRIPGGNVKLVLHELGDSPSLGRAMNACSHLISNGNTAPPETAAQLRTQRADELSFARCMRSHGLPRFPDPTSQGQLTVEMVQAQGIDVHSATVLQAVQACLPASHGALTAAKVREAIAHAGG